MPEILCQHRNKFNYYNTQSMRFRFDESLSLPDLQQVVFTDSGEQGLQELPGKISRSNDLARLRDLLFCNRAGENGKHLTFDECIEFYLS